MSESVEVSPAQKRLEAVLMGLLAALPVVPYAAFLIRTGVPRFELFGDFALLEHATRRAWTGDTLLGPYSRFHWHHPGPLLFYVIAPFQAMFGTASTGLYVGTCVVNAASAAALVVFARLFAGRAHATAALAVALAWFASFGNVSANPWNPLVVVLPLMVYLLTAALFAKGESAAIYPAVVFGALVAQTHIAVVTTVIATGVVALASFLVLRRAKLPSEGKWLDLATRRRLAIAASLLLLLFAPPLIEQVTADGKGNIRRIASFFLDRQAPVKPIGLAMRHWVTATSWLPDRLLSRSLATEGYFPLVMRWDAMPDHVTKTARAMTILHVGLTSIATMIAVRRRETTSAALLVLGSLTSLLAVPALQAIVGVSYHYLVFWTTAGSSIAWTGIGSMGLSMAAPWAVRLPRPTFLVVLGALGLPAALATTSLQQTWFSKYQLAPASRPRESKALSEIYAALRERVGAEKTAIVHWEGAWDMACAVILEHDKDRLDVRVPAKDRWLYSGVRGPEGVAKPLHVWFATTPLPLPLAPCLDFVAKRGDISLYTSPDDVTSCTPP